MRALVVYCHPSPSSFTAAVRDVAIARLEASGAEIRLIDIYGRGFQPILSREEWDGYLECPANLAPVRQDVEDLRWCDTLVFIYPTWWYGLPAALKGWLDRVLLPDVAFHMPTEPNGNIRRGLTQIRRLGVFTTCGATWWLTRLVGAPGKRTLLRGVGFMCAKPLRTAFAAHYAMDSSTPESRAAHLARVARQVNRLTGRRRPEMSALSERTA
ncbi:MAG: NAD(P)H-dependent oxidoreductase [Pseudomonadota bacterium]